MTEEKRAVSRCTSCRKKLGLTALSCRCGFQFCSAHYHAEEHNCSYDYKSVNVRPIAVVADKMGAERL